ncbi:MAG TPA: hypothetical protein VHO70_10345 [Chitinispirillaceae bacterium]|nr:hypothetical protein [Chitinispirillaceae bacterium]
MNNKTFITIVISTMIFSCNLNSNFPLQFFEFTQKEKSNTPCNKNILIIPGKYTCTVTDTINRFDNKFPDISGGIHYKPGNNGRSFDVRFLPGNNVVVLYDSVFTNLDSLVGKTISVTKDTITYEIDDHFAGRTFSVWREDTTLRAEYTLNGSGLPIVWSEMGTLTAQHD